MSASPDNIAVAGINNLRALAARFRVARCWRCRSRMTRTKGGSKCEKCGLRTGAK